MQDSIHSIPLLFDQLGLDSSEQAINAFISNHKPIAADIKLHEAKFWTEAQSTALKQLKDEDADWAIFVDELDVLLR